MSKENIVIVSANRLGIKPYIAFKLLIFLSKSQFIAPIKTIIILQ